MACLSLIPCGALHFILHVLIAVILLFFSFYSGGDLNSLNLLQLRSAVAVLFAFFLVKGIAHVKSGATSFYMELSRLWSTVL